MQVSLGGTVVKNPPAISGNARDAGSILGLEDPQRRKMYPTPVFLPGQRSLEGYSPGGFKELDTPEHTAHRCMYTYTHALA